MSRYHLGTLALTVALLLGLGPAHGGPAVGAPAPEFTATDSQGKTHSLADFRGSIVVLEWTNHECPFVQKHYESDNMQALQEAMTERGVVWLSVISSAPGRQGYVTPEQANRLTETRNADPTAVLLDPAGEISQRYEAKVTPHMFVIDTDGTLAYMGGIDDRPTTRLNDIPGARNYVRQAINELVAGQAVSRAVTRPYGCSIKNS